MNIHMCMYMYMYMIGFTYIPLASVHVAMKINVTVSEKIKSIVAKMFARTASATPVNGFFPASRGHVIII